LLLPLTNGSIFAFFPRGTNGKLPEAPEVPTSEEAAAYLNAALEEEAEDAEELFLLALRNVAKARGIAKLAEEAALNRESLYRALSAKGNPRLSTIGAVLDALGLRLVVEVKAA
jgi:probable addiction module antidote protein